MITGRPKKELDYPTVEKLCGICATETEIANWFDMTIQTLNEKCKENYGMTFLEVYKRYSDEGKMSIRRKQYQLALDGDRTMLIWLGKNMLGQKDSPMIDQSNNTLIDKRTFAYLSEKAIQEENDRTNRIKAELPPKQV